jgi:hypothetical protein
MGQVRSTAYLRITLVGACDIVGVNKLLDVRSRDPANRLGPRAGKT